MNRVQELIKKYHITPYGENNIRVELIKDAQDAEIAEIKVSKSMILKYFRDIEDQKRKEEELAIEKARQGKDGLFFVIDHDISCDIRVLVARRLTNEEKKKYRSWFAESAFASVGGEKTLKQIKFTDLPKRKADGTFSGGSDSVWVITPEEYDGYILENEKREKVIQEKEVEQQQKREEKKAQFEKEKRELLSQVDDWTITEHNISDEGGKTKLYKHRFLIGEKPLSFIERNVFDFGVVINPDYEISPGISGGLALKKDGILQWHTFTRDKGWVPVRSLTDQEQICWEIIKKYGKFAGAGIRM